MREYVLAARKSWNHRVVHERINQVDGKWHLFRSKEELDPARLETIGPEFIFFPHWSWMVPDSIVNEYECVAFHMTDLPYGRGGSPLQNLIERGHEQTKLTAFRMTTELDAGPIYCQRNLMLYGTAESIFLRTAELAADMIVEIIQNHPKPVPQQGEVVEFTRRTPEQSRVQDLGTLDALHDFIRMLDAEGYPHAFIEHEGFKLEFTRSARYDGELRADVRITAQREDDDD